MSDKSWYRVVWCVDKDIQSSWVIGRTLPYRDVQADDVVKAMNKVKDEAKWKFASLLKHFYKTECSEFERYVDGG